ncbi:MAG: nucleotidyltransferase domain-containing protein [Magnetococcus sp. DMHC-1]
MTMHPEDHEILTEFAQHIHARFPEAEVHAFGSRARGSAQADSDFDLCVILKDEVDVQSRHAIQDIAWNIGFEHGLVLTVLCFGKDEFYQGPRSASGLAKAILRDGVRA